MYRITVTNTTGTAGGWTSGSSADNNIPAGQKRVRYFDVQANDHSVGTNNDSLVLSGVTIPDISDSSVITTPAQIEEGFYVKVEALVGDREIVIFEHMGTS